MQGTSLERVSVMTHRTLRSPRPPSAAHRRRRPPPHRGPTAGPRVRGSIHSPPLSSDVIHKLVIYPQKGLGPNQNKLKKAPPPKHKAPLGPGKLLNAGPRATIGIYFLNRLVTPFYFFGGIQETPGLPPPPPPALVWVERWDPPTRARRVMDSRAMVWRRVTRIGGPAGKPPTLSMLPRRPGRSARLEGEEGAGRPLPEDARGGLTLTPPPSTTHPMHNPMSSATSLLSFTLSLERATGGSWTEQGELRGVHGQRWTADSDPPAGQSAHPHTEDRGEHN